MKSKRLLLRVLCTVFIVIFIAGCNLAGVTPIDPIETESGNLTLNIDIPADQARAFGLSTAPSRAVSDVTSVAIELTSKQYPSVSAAGSLVNQTASISISNIKPGNWIAKAYLKDGAGTTLYYGEKPVLIETGKANSLTVTVYATSSVDTTVVIGEKVESPVFDATVDAPNQKVALAITTKTVGASVLYTLDGKDPTSSSLAYSSPLTVSFDTIVKAIAVLGGNVSEVSTFSYKLPYFDPGPGTYMVKSNLDITVKSARPGVTMRVTGDCSLPTAGYGSIGGIGSKFYITEPRTLKVVSYIEHDPYSVSDVVAAEYKLKVWSPEFSVAPGTVNGIKTLYLTSSENSTIFYTTDGSDPSDTSSTTRRTFSASSPIVMSGDGSTWTIRAYAERTAWIPSDITQATYNVVYIPLPKPTFDIPGAKYDSAKTVTVSVPVKNALFKYTTDGSDPMTSATASVVSGTGSSGMTDSWYSMNVNSDMTIRVVAAAEGWLISPEASETYDVPVWHSVGAKGFSSGGITDPAVAVSSTGAVYAAFKNTAAGNVELMKFDGAVWTSMAAFSGGEYPTLKADKAGNVYLAYSVQTPSGTSSGYDRKLYVKKHDGTALSDVGSPITLYTASGSASAYKINLSLSGTGVPYVHYPYKSIWYLNGADWAVYSTYVNNYTPCDMAVDSSGAAYLAFRYSSSYIQVRKFATAGDATGTQIGAGIPASSTDTIRLVFSPSAELYLMYEEYSGIYFRAFSAATGTWSSSSQTVAYSGSVYSYYDFELAFSSTNKPYFMIDAALNSGSSSPNVGATVFTSSSWGLLETVGSSFSGGNVSSFDLTLTPFDVPIAVFPDPVNSNKATVMIYN